MSAKSFGGRQFDAQCHVVTSVAFSVGWVGLNALENFMISIFGARVAEFHNLKGQFFLIRRSCAIRPCNFNCFKSSEGRNLVGIHLHSPGPPSSHQNVFFQFQKPLVDVAAVASLNV